MNKFFIVQITLMLFVIGCAQAKDFKYGIKQINALNFRYNTTMETYPKNMQEINAMLTDLTELKKIQLQTGNEPFNYVINYRTLNLEAEKLFIQSREYGFYNIAKTGFACKPRPLVIESAALRNQSAQKGFEAVDLLKEFINKYPKESSSIGLSFKNALFLNATFYQVSRDARADSNIINHFCPKNITLEIYQQEFRKKTNLTEDFINKLSYEEAVPIWKEISSIS